MSKQELKICPVCKKGFSYRTRYGKDAITCSDNCKQTMAIVRREDPEEWSDMIREAESMRRPARQSCALYDTGAKCCTGLTGLWCEVEDCKFYKQRRVDNG